MDVGVQSWSTARVISYSGRHSTFLRADLLRKLGVAVQPALELAEFIEMQFGGLVEGGGRVGIFL